MCGSVSLNKKVSRQRVVLFCRAILILLPALIVSALLTMIVHGVGHLIVARLLGVDVRDFTPLPHLEDEGLSFTTIRYGDTSNLLMMQLGLLYMGGVIFTSGLAITLFLLLRPVSIDLPVLRLLGDGLVFWGLLDVMRCKDICGLAILAGLDGTQASVLAFLTLLLTFPIFVLNLDRILRRFARAR
jgi:hypothetical protein